MNLWDIIQSLASGLAKAFGKAEPTPAAVAEVPVVPQAPAVETVVPAAAVQPAGILTPEALHAIMPNLPAEKLAEYFPPLVAAMAEFDISTPRRIASFLAQVAHESQELRALEENLNYSAAGLLATWPNRFTVASAAEYARQSERIANRVYGGRLGNGPEESGDGWRYRGRGPIGITGLDNYRLHGQALGVDLVNNPDLAATPDVGFRVAGHFWQLGGINVPADAGDTVAVTRAVNGGTIGLADREAYYRRATEALQI